MILSTQDVLSEKKGMAAALGITMVGLSLLVAVGGVVVNYAILSKQASQLQTLSQEINNRAERYVSMLNEDLLDPHEDSGARECKTKPTACTMVTPGPPSADPKAKVLRITGDMGLGIVGQTLTKDVTLEAMEVTHVTALDEHGNKVWATTDEGLQYRVWSLAEGDPTKVKPEDISGPGVGATSWVSVTDRAGIDNTGALWVWGKNNIGQAGIGTISATPAAPKKLPGATGFRAVFTTDDRGYAIDSTGTVWVWGKNDMGQLGLGHKNNVLTPTKLPGTRMMTFAVGKGNVFGLGMDGELSVVGASQAGFPANTGLNSQVLNKGTTYKAVAASAAGAVAMIDSTGKLTMAGNAYPFTPSTVKFTSVSLGTTAGYAISDDGKLYSWGLGANGELGLGAPASAATPTQVKDGTAFASVVGGKTSAFAIDVSGRLYYFGKTPAGAVGGAELPTVNVPTPLLAESRFRGIAANDSTFGVALLDTAGNIYGLGTEGPGLWPMSYLGANNQPIRMPVPDGFPSYTWE